MELTRELTDLALGDVRFERAAALAGELEDELARLTGETLAAGRRRRGANRRTSRSPRTAARVLKSFQAECQALETTVRRFDEHGIAVSARQLSDLRLGERTRQIFQDAGLLYVQDVANLPAAQAMDVPQLTPASLAELRAAIMCAIETAGAQRPKMLPPPGHGGDLFDGLVQSVNLLPPRERETVVLRAGVGDRVYEVDEVARAIDCAPEQVAQLERHALNSLLAQPGTIESCWRLEDLCAQLGLGWDDGRLPTVVAARYPNTRASFTRLATWLMREKGQLSAESAGRSFNEPRGIAHFDEMVVAALGRYGDLSEGALTNHVRAGLSALDLEHYPEVDVSERVQILGPAVQMDAGVFHLPNAPIPGVDDRHIRALNGLIGALQRLGSARISALTTEVNRRLPRSYYINEQYVRTWLTRHPELFTQSDPERFKLASLDVDILCGLATAWMPSDTAPSLAASRPGSVAMERLHERVAAEIASLLRREGPQPIGRIRSHLYGRFIGLASADLVISESPQRFMRQPGGLISLRDGDEAAPSIVIDVSAPPPAPVRRMFLWQRH